MLADYRTRWSASNLRLFPAYTRIQTSSTTPTVPTALRVGDLVLACAARADKGRGARVPRRVTRLYCNATTDWIRLCWFVGTARWSEAQGELLNP
jgi:hypothetical protein